MAAEPGSSLPSTRLSPDLIFLSFAGVDRVRVEPVAAALRARGASVWYDAGSTAGGGNYVASVQRALGRAGAMLVFVSANSSASAWVADEVRAYRSLMVREPGHKLLVIHLDRTRAPLALAGVDSVDARDAQPEVTASLITSALANPALLPAQSPSATSPRMPAVAPVAPASMPPAPQQPAAAQPRAGAAAPVATGQVFVSYARSDRDRVQPLTEALRARGVAVWDDSGLAHGSQGWVETARGALDRSQTLLVAVSAAAVASPWVMDDVRAFQSLKTRDPGRALVAVHLDKTRAPLSLANAHVIDAQSLGPSDAAGLITASLPAGAVQRAAAPTPPPPAPPSAPPTFVTEAAPVAIAGGALTVEPSARDGATMPAAASVEAAPVAPATAPPPPEPAAAVEAPPAPETLAPAPAPAPATAPEAAVAEAAPEAAPAAPSEKAPAGIGETAPAPVVTPAAAVAASPTLAEKSAEAKGGGRAGEVVALLVVLLIAIAIAWALSFL